MERNQEGDRNDKTLLHGKRPAEQADGHPQKEADAEPTPPRIPRYDISRVLGRGGMGVVYLARDTRLGRDVAVKMLAGWAAGSPELLMRFHAEAEAVAQLQHPGIAQVFDAGQADGCPYITMEYLSGGTLEDQVRNVPQTPREAAETVEALARAMHASHERGILHRDLKPANVLISSSGELKITDFGLAKFLERDDGATRTGQVMGTPSYMAPEQASGVVRKLGPACDIYALGAILYQLSTGRPPFQSPDSVQTLLMVISDEPVPPRRLQPKLPRDLETICLKCLNKSPSKRYASVVDLADDLHRFCRGEPILARPISWWERAVRFSRRRPAVAALIAVVAIALTIVVGGGAWYNARLRAELDRSQSLFDGGRELAHWMLFDHSEDLGRLQGSTGPQQRFVEKMMQYLDQMSQLATDDQTLLRELAMGYRRVAQVQGDPNYSNLGRTEEALKSYRRAVAVYDQMLEFQPGDALLQRERALCRASISSILVALGRRGEAVVELDQTLAEVRRLTEDAGHTVPMRQALFLLLQQKASMTAGMGDVDQALTFGREAFRLAEQIASQEAQDPNAQRLLALAHSQLGRLCETAGQFDEAKQHYQETLDRVEAIVPETPDDVRTLRDLSVALIALGDLLAREENDTETLDCYQRAVQLRRRQVQVDPDSATVQRDLAVALERVARHHEQQGQYAMMLEPLDESLRISLALAKADPKHREHQRDLWIKRAALARALMFTQRLDEATEQMYLAREIAARLVAEDAADTNAWQGVAETAAGQGDIAIATVGNAPNVEAAMAAMRRAVQCYDEALQGYQQVERQHALSSQQQSLCDALRQRREIACDALQRMQATVPESTQDPDQ